MVSTRTPVYLGLDVGTASTKGVLVSRDGDVVAMTTRTHRVLSPQPGFVEIDPEIIWREVLSIIDELSTSTAVVVLAMSVSAMGPCVVLTDRQGSALTPAILYGVDTRNESDNRSLTRELSNEKLVAISGNVLSSQSAGSKLLWLRRERSDVWGSAFRFHSLASYLVYRLTGEYVMDHHTASQFDPLYDLDGACWWHDGVQAVLGDSAIEMPALAWSDQVVGNLQQPIGAIEAGVPVTAGLVDAWAEAVSVGADAPNQLMLMYGTTMFLIANSDSRRQGEGLWSTRAADSATYSLAGGTATSGAITHWWSEIFGEPDFGMLISEAAGTVPGSNGLLTLPYFAGERTPFFDPDARGLVVGLTTQHNRGDLYRSALEATGFAVRHNLEHFARSGSQVAHGTAVGGGAQSELWPQIVSDITGLPQMLRKRSIGAAYGDAVLAATALEGRPSLDLWNPMVTHIDPRAETSALYDDLFARYIELHDIVRPAMHHLAELQRTSNA